MKPGFQQLDFNIRTTDGLNIVFTDPVQFLRDDGTLLQIPVGSTSDGLSDPVLFQNIIPAVGRPTWKPSTIHDSGYRDFLQIWDGTDFVPAHWDQKQCDDLILEAMKSEGVDAIERDTIYAALRAFGHKAFADDRAAVAAAKQAALDAAPSQIK